MCHATVILDLRRALFFSTLKTLFRCLGVYEGSGVGRRRDEWLAENMGWGVEKED